MTTDGPSMSNDMPFAAEDLRNFDFDAIVILSEETKVDGQEGRTCYSYKAVFDATAKSAEESGDSTAIAICSLFSHICSKHFYLNDHFKGDNFTINYLRQIKPFCQVLQDIVIDIRDAELQAVVADVLWTLKHDEYFKMGMLAADAYLRSARLLEGPTNSSDCTKRIERALQISARLDRDGESFLATIAYIENLLHRLNDGRLFRGCGHLLRLLLDFNAGGTHKCISLSRRLAESAETAHDWEGARAHWSILAKWYEKDDCENDAKDAKVLAARTYASEATAIMEQEEPNYIRAIGLLRRGIEDLRRNGAPSHEVDRVHVLLLQHQKENDNYFEFKSSVDVTDPVTRARHSVKGKSLRESILTIAISFRSPSIEQLRNFANELQENYPMQFLATKQRIDGKGKVVGQRPGIGFDNPYSNDSPTRTTMFEEAVRHQEVTAFAHLLPALEQINLEHNIVPEDLLEFVNDNPFVPPQHEKVFLRGLYFGLRLDFMLSTHLLVPQIENSIRYVLEQRGAIASSMNSQGIQEE